MRFSPVGQGRDSIAFASAGIDVTATDYAAECLTQLAAQAANLGVADRVETRRVDVR